MRNAEPSVTEQEAEARFREFVDALDVDETAPSRGARAGAESNHPQHHRRWVVVASVAATLLLLATVFGGLRLVAPPAVPAAGQQIVFPETLPKYRHLPVPSGVSPPGRVLLSYQHGGEYEFMDLIRGIVLASDGRTVRRFTPPEDRSALGSNGPTLVSPDGALVAVGTYGWSGDVVLVDARTAGARTISVTPQPQRSVVPLSWSPDGTWLYVRDADAEDASKPGLIRRIDAARGRVEAVPGVSDRPDVISVMPDAEGRLLVMRRDATQVLDTSGRVLGTYPAITEAERAQNAWSPDGRFVATATPAGLEVRDLSSGRVRVHGVVGLTGLAWTDTHTYVMQEVVPQGANANSRLTEVDVVTGERWVLARWEDTWTGAAVHGLSIAPGLAWHWQAHRTPWTPPGE